MRLSDAATRPPPATSTASAADVRGEGAATITVSCRSPAHDRRSPQACDTHQHIDVCVFLLPGYGESNGLLISHDDGSDDDEDEHDGGGGKDVALKDFRPPMKRIKLEQV